MVAQAKPGRGAPLPPCRGSVISERFILPTEQRSRRGSGCRPASRRVQVEEILVQINGWNPDLLLPPAFCWTQYFHWEGQEFFRLPVLLPRLPRDNLTEPLRHQEKNLSWFSWPEAFNAFNTPQFNNPDARIGFASVGRISSAGTRRSTSARRGRYNWL